MSELIARDKFVEEKKETVKISYRVLFFEKTKMSIFGIIFFI